MILADTNVVVALLVADRPEQTEAALSFCDRAAREGSNVLVCESVLVEACWVLERSYGIARQTVAELVGRLVAAPPLKAWDPPLVADALGLLNRKPALSVTDALLACRAARDDAEIVTFDQALKKLLDG